jgi:DNA primase
VATDPDDAGDKVATEMIQAISGMTRDCKLRRVRLEKGEEHDEVDRSYLRQRLQRGV